MLRVDASKGGLINIGAFSAVLNDRRFGGAIVKDKEADILMDFLILVLYLCKSK